MGVSFKAIAEAQFWSAVQTMKHEAAQDHYYLEIFQENVTERGSTLSTSPSVFKYRWAKLTYFERFKLFFGCGYSAIGRTQDILNTLGWLKASEPSQAGASGEETERKESWAKERAGQVTDLQTKCTSLTLKPPHGGRLSLAELRLNRVTDTFDRAITTYLGFCTELQNIEKDLIEGAQSKKNEDILRESDTKNQQEITRLKEAEAKNQEETKRLKEQVTLLEGELRKFKEEDQKEKTGKPSSSSPPPPTTTPTGSKAGVQKKKQLQQQAKNTKHAKPEDTPSYQGDYSSRGSQEPTNTTFTASALVSKLKKIIVS